MAQTEAEYTFRMGSMVEKIRNKYPQLMNELTEFVNASLPISTDAAYNEFLRGVAGIITSHQKELVIPTPVFDEEFQWIGNREPYLPTPWGGVYYYEVWDEKHEMKHFKKDLIIRAKGILGFEDHTKKHEELETVEGFCIGMSSKSSTSTQVSLTLMQPGDRCVLEPGDAHGIIALTPCVIRETSLDNGHDLHFIFNSEQVI